MSSRREFEIAFVGLKPGLHEFSYEIDDRFFEDFQEQDFHNCQAQVKLLLEKNHSFMMLKFEIGGSVELTCDRCNSNLPFQLFDDFTVTVKMTEDPDVMNDQEEDPDVYYISKGESHLDVKGWIYEFINLSIPMQRSCGYENMDGPYCNPAARELLNGMRPEEGRPENPIWNELKKLRGFDES
ncbi:MAG: DUF177 domain-containing protein [Flavisolibacter sp.]|nr:DUF177 domain-containing protein [Flavisolibacter sp.]MBD0352660.1 DUF177 domain-containing protein [Flavisolibacter sp.]MBD0366594.1 DUF177 domain-containing protein [Flavisolibacter sp.]